MDLISFYLQVFHYPIYGLHIAIKVRSTYALTLLFRAKSPHIPCMQAPQGTRHIIQLFLIHFVILYISHILYKPHNTINKQIMVDTNQKHRSIQDLEEILYTKICYVNKNLHHI